MVSPMRAFSGSNILRHDPGPTRRSRQITYPVQQLIKLHKLVLRKLSQVRPTRRVSPGSSRALLACGMISNGEHSQKGSGNQRNRFFSLVFLSLLFWVVSHPSCLSSAINPAAFLVHVSFSRPFVLVGWISRRLDALSGWRFQPIPWD
jgi:hypothetical protein